MTIGDIKIVIDSFIESHKRKIEETQQSIYTISALTASFVSRAINGKEIPSFESIFKPEKEAENEVIMFREKMKIFAHNANRNRRQ